jgi:hypothetical protein
MNGDPIKLEMVTQEDFRSFLKVLYPSDNSNPSGRSALEENYPSPPELVQATTITDDDALQIDIGAETTAYKLFRIRELRIAGKLSSAKKKMEEIFKEELDCLRTTEKMFTDSNVNDNKRGPPA